MSSLEVGSAMVERKRSGFFFCPKIGEQNYLRFVPTDVSEIDDVLREVGTCLRLIECDEKRREFYQVTRLNLLMILGH